MKWIKWVFPVVLGVLVGCSSETEEQRRSTAKHVAITEDFNAAAASSEIATQILNSPQEQDILSSSRQAMSQVNASDVMLAQQQAASVAVAPTESLALPALPAVCERYFQRVERCFSTQENSEALLAMNEEAKEAIAQEKHTEEACLALDQSFDAVARNLGCQ